MPVSPANAFVQDPHFDGYGAVIVRPETVDEADLVALLTQGCQEQAAILAAQSPPIKKAAR